MPTSADDTTLIDAARIRSVLMDHPDIVREDAELFSRIIGDRQSDGVIDLAAAAREKLVSEIRQLKAINESIVETARANLAIQSQIHTAVLALLEVDSLPALDSKIASRLTGALGVDVCRVLIEGHAPLQDGVAIMACAEGVVGEILGDKVERLGLVDPERAHEVYGQDGARMRSQALVRLDFNGREGVFALAARDPQLFQFGQGTELLNFLARAVERLVMQWLHPR